VGLLVSNILLRAHCDRNHLIRRMQGAAPGVRLALSGAAGGRGKHIWSCNHVDGVRVDPGRRFRQRLATLWPWDSPDLETRHAGRGSRAGDQLETSFREPIAVHPGADLRPLRAGPTGIRKINRRCRKSWSRQQAGCAAGSPCHYPNGKGRPEHAGVAGLPACYFIQTMIDFRDRIARARTRAKPTPTG
jgi:hypothetical protein